MPESNEHKYSLDTVRPFSGAIEVAILRGNFDQAEEILTRCQKHLIDAPKVLALRTEFTIAQALGVKVFNNDGSRPHGLRSKIVNQLESQLNAITVDDLLRYSDAELLQLQEFGERSIEVIREALERLGYRWPILTELDRPLPWVTDREKALELQEEKNCVIVGDLHSPKALRKK